MIVNVGNLHIMALKVLWIKILIIKLTNSSKHSLMLAKTGIEVHLMHEFMPLEPFLVFLQYRGAFKARDCASETISILVATNMLNPQLRSKTHVCNFD